MIAAARPLKIFDISDARPSIVCSMRRNDSCRLLITLFSPSFNVLLISSILLAIIGMTSDNVCIVNLIMSSVFVNCSSKVPMILSIMLFTIDFIALVIKYVAAMITSAEPNTAIAMKAATAKNATTMIPIAIKATAAGWAANATLRNSQAIWTPSKISVLAIWNATNATNSPTIVAPSTTTKSQNVPPINPTINPYSNRPPMISNGSSFVKNALTKAIGFSVLHRPVVNLSAISLLSMPCVPGLAGLAAGSFFFEDSIFVAAAALARPAACCLARSFLSFLISNSFFCINLRRMRVC